MHVADGLLSPAVCLATGAVAAGTVGLSLRQLNQSLSVRTVPLTAMLAALIFAGQMVNFPLFGAPVSGHLLGGVLAAVMLGPWAGCVALALVLCVQLVLFSDGGWLAYGANVLNMGVVGSLGGYAVYTALRRWFAGNRGVVIAAVIAAWVSVLAASTLFCIEFACSHPREAFDLSRIFLLMTSFHSLIGVGEALITGGVLSYIVAVRPDLIYQPATTGGLVTGTGRVLWTGAVVALAIAAFLAPFASEYADGLEAVAERTQMNDLEKPPAPLVLADYEIPLPWVDDASPSAETWRKISVSFAGIFGTACVLAIALGFGWMLRPRITSVGQAVSDTNQ